MSPSEQLNGSGGGAFRKIRISTSAQSSAPKLKLRLGGRGAETSSRLTAGYHGSAVYGSDLDESDEDYHHEEQIFLRMPPGEDAQMLSKMVADRTSDPSVWFKFKDSRRAVFHVGEHLYSARLVDLPNIVESNKTLDRKQIFKVADISQMIVVEDLLEKEEDLLANAAPFNVENFIWPHGMTPPLRHVRKRRFRKRLSKRAIETVEGEVERLLEEDNRADSVKYDIYDVGDPNLSGSEFGSPSRSQAGVNTPLPLDDALSNAGDGTEHEDDMGRSVQGDMSELGDRSRFGSEDEDGNERDGEGDDFDADFAAELERDMGDHSDEGELQTDTESRTSRKRRREQSQFTASDADSGQEDDDDDGDISEKAGAGSDDENEEDDEVLTAKRKERLLASEIVDLERKCNELQSTSNSVIKQRLDTVLLPMLQTKREQLLEAQDDLEALRQRKNRENESAEEDGGDSNDELFEEVDNVVD